ncbi:hypothetical protein JVT61DRAFT_5085 [Boletus reticuloceps]|uniref:Uncharacterized protein n=1 Tax=Boletus reticuloceps TaxID=495285 RepID=A0A8I2Z1U3_9AGAM|nr:hypothetical protein JVT61DRAFT_5085 [Boletus reticuloceps]
MDDSRSCLGCQKSFTTLKKLHAHEARCLAYTQWKSRLAQTHQRRKATEDNVENPQPVPHPFGPTGIAGQANLDLATLSSWAPLIFRKDSADNPIESEPGPPGSHAFEQDVPMDESLDADLDAGPSGPALDSEHQISTSQPPDVPPLVTTRSRRPIRLPARYTDYLPTAAGLRHVPSPPPLSPSTRQSSPLPSVDTRPAVEYRTLLNDMGLFRVYQTKPSFVPMGEDDILTFVDAPTLETSTASQPSRPMAIHLIPEPQIMARDNLYSAFSSPSAGLLMCWQYSGTNEKSGAELNRLWSFVTDPQFRASSLDTFNHEREKKLVEKHLREKSNPFHVDHGWKTSSVSILLPHEGTCWPLGERDPSIPTLTVKEIYRRDITDIIVATLQDDIASTYHLTPFKEYWQPDPTTDPIRVFGEAYSSPEWLNLHQSVQSLPREPGDDVERVVIPIMLWSDATQLTNFGNASLWPIYMFFGNQSKYTRGKPTAAACHHIAYIPKLPDGFQDEYVKHFCVGSSDSIYTHCKRELMQEIWKVLLDEKFIKAYKYGLEIKFTDQVVRRGFPRFYTYAADYPEKVLLVCIKFLGVCLCPRCLAEKGQVSQMGTPADMDTRENDVRVDDQSHRRKISRARRYIFERGSGINGAKVKKLLASESLVPTKNAFSERVQSIDQEFNYFLMFVVDLLHEFELGVWKAIFTHLMRILYAVGGTGVQQLNYRYRRVPTFGRGTIRRFHKNASAMSRLASRDFEDLLQCAMPVFEGLLPCEHNDIVLDLLFDLATWHAFAKLRLHTDQTLEFFDAATIYLGRSVRKFERTTCAYYHTTELPQEHAARGRRTAALAAKQGHKISSASSAKVKRLNLSTYKFHALGHYPDTIRRYGTTDNYNTQTGELEHRRAKRRFPRSGKKKDLMIKSMTNQDAIERFIRKVDVARRTLNQQDGDLQPRRARTSPLEHHSIAQSSRTSNDLTTWLGRRQDDPAFRDFLPRLKDHLLARARGLTYDGDEHDFSDNDRYCINIKDNQIYHHALLRVNYTTYDLRREQDTINPLTRPDIMVLSHEDERSHPYWYARVIHIFHVMVQHRENTGSPFSAPMRMNVLFVRWFGRDVNYPSGWSEKRLYRLQFFDQESPSDAFGFLDPDSVVRGIHLIPAFGFNRTDELLGLSQARRMQDEDNSGQDWKYYYVNMFVDRDVFMRFRGGGVGHKMTWDWNQVLCRDPGRPVDDEDSEMEEVAEETARMEEAAEEVAGMEELEAEAVRDDGSDNREEGVGDNVVQEHEEEEFEAWEHVMEHDDVIAVEGDDGTDESEGEEDNPDRVTPDEGEELDDNIYATEGEYVPGLCRHAVSCKASRRHFLSWGIFSRDQDLQCEVTGTVIDASRSVASSSRAELHTSAICLAKRQAPKRTVSKLQAKVDRKHTKDANRLYVVLGSEYNKEDKWTGCDLQKTVLTPDDVYSQDAKPQVLHLPEGELKVPSHLNFGIEGGQEKKLLFEVLPTLTVERGVTTFDEDTVERAKAAMDGELQKANMFARLADLRNANAKGLAYESRRRIIVAFSTPQQPNDTGRPEVQAALMTFRIRNLWSHLLKFRKDVANRRALRQLVHDRAKVLHYLKRLDRDRYEAILPRLGLDKGSVEGELVI